MENNGIISEVSQNWEADRHNFITLHFYLNLLLDYTA